MDESELWKIIAAAKKSADGDCDAFADALVERLTKLSAPEIESFDAILSAKLTAAYTWRLWGAAYLINGGCSDDGFEYFRCWLIGQGRKLYEDAVADPERLAKVVDPENDQHECEALLGVAMRAHEALTGNPLPTAVPGTLPPKPAGDGWDFDDEELMARYLPKLSRLYGEAD